MRRTRRFPWRGVRPRRGIRPPWFFVVPALIVYAFVILVPSVRGVNYSFSNWNGLDPHWAYVGLSNFVRVLQDPLARDVILRTSFLAVAVAIFQTAAGLMLAIGLDRQIKGRNAFRVMFFTPVIVMPIVTAYLWRYILGSGGPINQILQSVGLHDLAQPWLGNPTLAFWSIILVVVWQFTGYSMVIFLAGLQTIPKELLEASSIDGAGAKAQFAHITWPLLRPALTVNLLVIMIIGLKLFDQVWVMTQGGPGSSTDTLATAMYRTTFLVGDFGYGAAMAVVLTAIVALVVALQYRLLNN